MSTCDRNELYFNIKYEVITKKSRQSLNFYATYCDFLTIKTKFIISNFI